MLPSEVFTLVLMVSAAAAGPAIYLNTTNIYVPPIVHIESTASGFDRYSSSAVPSTSPNPIITPTYLSASLVFAHTEIRESGFEEPTPTPTPTERTPPHSQYHEDPNSHSFPPSPSPSSDLLDEIILHLNPQPGSHPTAPPSPSTIHPEPNAQNTIPGNEETEITTVPEEITLGPATVTLSPGLSTTIGDGDAETFLSITTSDGLTVLVISSSRTEVTAAVTQVPITGLETGVSETGTAAAATSPASSLSMGSVASPTPSYDGSAGMGRSLDRWLVGVAGWIAGGMIVL
ncbi:hypothetical protein CC78DRAFT_538396 [Lojkania enalia]|uniref:Uncharacterized protein n=1 Tax=Lojkania enalia TaxID=147567 RepID=A0A9P4JZ38_9PLEO|nr:hypothetical protein CC78DRAFT_538396 [Didymosphaeria enalia]